MLSKCPINASSPSIDSVPPSVPSVSIPVIPSDHKLDKHAMPLQPWALCAPPECLSWSGDPILSVSFPSRSLGPFLLVPFKWLPSFAVCCQPRLLPPRRNFSPPCSVGPSVFVTSTFRGWMLSLGSGLLIDVFLFCFHGQAFPPSGPVGFPGSLPPLASTWP